MNLTTTVAKLLRPVRRRIGAMITRGYVLNVDAGGKRIRLKVGLREGEIADLVELLEPYGFSAPPLPDRDGVLTLALGGHGNHRVGLNAGGRKHRPRDLKPGEVCLYTDEGDEIRLKRGRVIGVVAGEKLQVDTKEAVVNATTKATVTSPEITAVASTSVRLETPLVYTTGQIQAEGDITDQVAAGGVSMASMRDTYDGHTHPGDSGGTTGSPNQTM